MSLQIGRIIKEAQGKDISDGPTSLYKPACTKIAEPTFKHVKISNYHIRVLVTVHILSLVWIRYYETAAQ